MAFTHTRPTQNPLYGNPKRRKPSAKKPAAPTPQAPAPSQPAAPTVPSPQALPIDPIHTGDLGAINLNFDNTVAGIGFDRTQLGQQYGFDSSGNIDPSNPYSVAANLQRRYQQGQSGTTNSMAARGQLYSGATQRNLDEGTFQYSRDYDSARRAAAGGYQDLNEREQRANFDKTIGIGEADQNRLGRLRPEDVVAPVSSPYSGPNRTQDGGPGVKPSWMTDAQWAKANKGRAKQRRRPR